MTDHSGLCRRLRALKILDEVGSDNPLSREDADAIEALQARAEKAEAQRDALAKEMEKIADHMNWGEDGTWGGLSYPDEIARAALDAIKGESQ